MDQLFRTEKQKKNWRRKIERKMKINDVTAMFLGLSSVLLAFFETEDFYGELHWTGDIDANGEQMFTVVKTQYQEKPFNTGMRLVIGLSSVVLVGLIYNHYRIMLELNKAKQKVDSYDTLRSTGMIWWMLLECAYCMVHTPPGLNFTFSFGQLGYEMTYSYDELIFIAMLGRIYLIWRIFANYSSWNDERAEEICNSCLCESGVSFALKAELKERPYLVVGFVMTVSIFVYGVALRNAERPFMYHSKMDWDYVWNGLWCIIITMATVGYGDFYPSTHLGRMIGVLACFWGTFLVSLMVVSLTISSEFTPQERKAFDKIKKDEAQEELRVKAANAIKFALKARIYLKNNPYVSDKKKANYINRFKSAMINYRTHKRNLVASEQDAPIEFILAKLNDKVSNGLDRIKSDCHIYKTLLARLENAESSQKKLEDDLNALSELNNSLLEKLKTMELEDEAQQQPPVVSPPIYQSTQ
jgi:hypothetical protein